MKSSTPRAHGLDTLRSVAILSVVLFHIHNYGGESKLPEWLVPVAKQGWMGVDLFFVLSGYLIGSQLLRPYLKGERPGLWVFYRNRFYRVLPAYLVVLAIYFFVPVWREDPNLAPAWAFLTFTLNLVIGRVNAYGFSHAWSLCVEEHFYLILPLLVLWLMRRPSLRKCVAVVGGLVLFGMCLRAFILFHWLRPMAQTDDGFGMFYLTQIYYPTYSRLDGLMAGVMLAMVKLFRPVWWNWLTRRGHALTVLGLGLVGISVWLFMDRYESVTGVSAAGTVIGFPVLALGLGALVASSLSNNGVLSRSRVPGAKLIATLAYSLYLTQKALIHLVGYWFPIAERWGSYRWVAIYAACCLVVAGVLYLLIERPFLILRDRWG